MSKRHINKQQTRRILQQQDQRRRRAAAVMPDAALAEHELNAALGPEQPGLLISCYGVQVAVEGTDGKLVRCVLRQNLGTLAAGDQVIWRCTIDRPDCGVVVALCPRRSVLGRPNKQSTIRPVAANIDQMLIVIAPRPQPTMSLLDSYLVAAELLQLQAVIILNKVDLMTANAMQEFMLLLQCYQKLGYICLTTSQLINEGLNDLRDILNNKVSVFVGQSGVGKSSLIAALLPHAAITIGDISHATAFGKHTTSNSTLYHLPENGGDIIDSPGIREFGLWHMPVSQLAQGFKEFAPYLTHCKYRDCIHSHEPGCALIQAVAAGLISQQRLHSYHKLVLSLDS